MSRLARARLVLTAVFIAAYGSLMAVVHHQLDRHALEEAEHEVRQSLVVHEAMRGYVTETLRPEIFRLQKEGLMSADYFTAKLMSFTFIVRRVHDLLNAQRRERGMAETYFKLATDNPFNPDNQADAAESRLLRRMNAGEIGEYRQIEEIDGRRFLYLAVPVERTDRSCLRCHGDPAAAPSELVRVYGDQRGFGERMGDIRAMISIRAPLYSFEAKARRTLAVVGAAAFLALASIYALISFFLTRLDAQQQMIVHKNAQLEHLSATDPLTGAYNRRGLMLRLEEEIARAQRFGFELCLILFDVDHFKRINDSHGHHAGDEALAKLAAVVSAAIRGSDVFGRWGGEEFIVVVPQEGLVSATRIAEKLRLAVAAAPLVSGVPLTISIGVSQYRDGETASDVIARADRALYAAKAAGRDRTVALAAEAG